MNTAEVYFKVGLNIGYYRREAGMTQLELAERADISRVHMGRIERGDGVSLGTMVAISNALGVELYKFFQFNR